MSKRIKILDRKIRREAAKESMKEAQKEKEAKAQEEQDFKDKGWARLSTEIRLKLKKQLDKKREEEGITIKGQVNKALEKELEESD